LKYNVLNIEEARRTCISQWQPKCMSYMWSPVERHETYRHKKEVLPPNTLTMCSDTLVGAQAGPRSEVSQRLRTYYIRQDTSNRCDPDKKITIIANITSNMEARMACDKQRKPKCRGYIWSGPIGVGRNPEAKPTPNMAMLCQGYKKFHPTSVPNSLYETAAVIGDYMQYPDHFASCSPSSRITAKYDVSSSLHARQHCDAYDGRDGPRCLSYVWTPSKGEALLCGGVPQIKLERRNDSEVGFSTPKTCDQIANRWQVAYNKTWGSATSAIKRIYLKLGCKTSFSSCQTLSDFYQLEPKMKAELVDRVPGSIRDLWLAQGCTTTPSPIARDRMKPVYQEIAQNVDDITAHISNVEKILGRAVYAEEEASKRDLKASVRTEAQRFRETLNRIENAPNRRDPDAEPGVQDS
jgi:hypothetical protein